MKHLSVQSTSHPCLSHVDSGRDITLLCTESDVPALSPKLPATTISSLLLELTVQGVQTVHAAMFAIAKSVKRMLNQGMLAFASETVRQRDPSFLGGCDQGACNQYIVLFRFRISFMMA